MNNSIINIIKKQEVYDIYNTSAIPIYFNITNADCNGIESVSLSGNIAGASTVSFTPTKDGEYLLSFTGSDNVEKTIPISHFPTVISSFVKNIEELLCYECDCDCNDNDENCIGKEAKQCLKYQNALSEAMFLFGLIKTIASCKQDYTILYDTFYTSIMTNYCSLFSYFCEGQLDKKVKGTYKYNIKFIQKQLGTLYLLLYLYEKEITNVDTDSLTFLNTKYNYSVIKECLIRVGVNITETEQNFMLNYYDGCSDNPVCTIGCIIATSLYAEQNFTFDTKQIVNGIYDTVKLKNNCSTPQLFVNKAIYKDNDFSVTIKANTSTNPTTIQPGQEIDVNVVFTGTKPVYTLIPVIYNNEGVDIRKYNILFRDVVIVNNTPPVIQDFVKVIENRTSYTFTIQDFESNFTDANGDILDKVILVGDTSNFTLNGLPYQSGTIITRLNISKLVYTPLDTNTLYEIVLNWAAYDSRGLESN